MKLTNVNCSVGFHLEARTKTSENRENREKDRERDGGENGRGGESETNRTTQSYGRAKLVAQQVSVDLEMGFESRYAIQARD